MQILPSRLPAAGRWWFGMLWLATSTIQAQEPTSASVVAAERGRSFLVELIHPQLKLLPEFAGHQVIWLYHDNYLAAKVLEKSHPEQSAQLRQAMASYGVDRSGKIELLFGESELRVRI